MDCKHIVGYALDESNDTNLVRSGDEADYIQVERFKFCPDCGAQLLQAIVRLGKNLQEVSREFVRVGE